MKTGKLKIKKVHWRQEKHLISNSLASLAKSNRLIRIEKEKEAQFMKICCQIKLGDLRQTRSEKQKNERQNKRKPAGT